MFFFFFLFFFLFQKKKTRQETTNNKHLIVMVFLSPSFSSSSPSYLSLPSSSFLQSWSLLHQDHSTASYENARINVTLRYSKPSTLNQGELCAIEVLSRRVNSLTTMVLRLMMSEWDFGSRGDVWLELWRRRSPGVNQM